MNGLIKVDEVAPVIQKASRWVVLVQESRIGMEALPSPRQQPRIVRMRPARRFAW